MAALSAAAIIDPSATPTTPTCEGHDQGQDQHGSGDRARQADRHVVARAALGAEERERDAAERVEEDDRGGEREEEQVVPAVEHGREGHRRQQHEREAGQRGGDPDRQRRAEDVRPLDMVCRLPQVPPEERLRQSEPDEHERQGDDRVQDPRDANARGPEHPSVDRHQQDRDRLVGDPPEAIDERVAGDAAAEAAPGRGLGHVAARVVVVLKPSPTRAAFRAAATDPGSRVAPAPGPMRSRPPARRSRPACFPRRSSR